MKPLLVGEANPYGASPAMALYPLPEGASGDRLCRLIMGLERRDYLKRFDRVNLCPERWSQPLARANARAIMNGEDRVVVLLGSKVAGAFGYLYEPFTVKKQDWVEGGTGPRTFVLLPHPSGLCRAWNNDGAYDKAREALRLAGVLA